MDSANGLTRAAAADLGPENRVNAIEPGFVETPLAGDAFAEGTELREQIDELTPLERVAQPDEIRRRCRLPPSDAASFTIGETPPLTVGTTTVHSEWSLTRTTPFTLSGSSAWSNAACVSSNACSKLTMLSTSNRPV